MFLSDYSCAQNIVALLHAFLLLMHEASAALVSSMIHTSPTRLECSGFELLHFACHMCADTHRLVMYIWACAVQDL